MNAEKGNFLQLEEIAVGILAEIAKKSDVRIYTINHRIKEEKSLAGLLEIADEHFVRIRDSVASYTKSVHDKIINDDANSVAIDSVSLSEYMANSRNMQNFLTAVANLCEAEITPESPDSYLEQLAWLKICTIGELQQMLAENSSLALQMIRTTLAAADLDILSSTVALRFLCRAELIRRKCTQEQATDFFMLSTGKKERAMRYAQQLLAQYA